MKFMATWFAGKHEKAIDVVRGMWGQQEESWTVPMRVAESSWHRERATFRKLLTLNDR
ncbi:hypothetical protein [Paenibacillus taichungensis]